MQKGKTSWANDPQLKKELKQMMVSGLRTGIPYQAIVNEMELYVMSEGIKASEKKILTYIVAVGEEALSEFKKTVADRQVVVYKKFTGVAPLTRMCRHDSTIFIDGEKKFDLQNLKECLDCGAVGVATFPHSCRWEEVGYSLLEHKKKWLCVDSFALIVGSEKLNPNVEEATCMDFVEPWLRSGESYE